ncbi:Imm26 family immunity protein [Gemmobacter nectariphilus]|uniref:Imm26 family immunity protein n=1 Tax=Gemmobacter nectariphilus TaxID=220343 RepID=UPI0009FC0220|nr:Imm26 family immunity protein [Gemmobacter nectariphilus]
MKMKKKKAKPGDFLSIPLPNGRYGFGKFLGSEVSFLDLVSDIEFLSVADLSGVGELFRAWVDKSALSSRSKWIVIGREELKDSEKIPNKYFMKDSISGDLRIYSEDTHDAMSWSEIPATYEECLGLEAAAVWSAEQIESRLMDYFEGRENKYVQSLALRKPG